tara:strand:- start:691 stop:912 length:222 start_codon:yes stop_codon:yes gene_type:complete
VKEKIMLKKALAVAVPSLLIGSQAQASVVQTDILPKSEQHRLVSEKGLLDGVEIESVTLNEGLSAPCKGSVGL